MLIFFRGFSHLFSITILDINCVGLCICVSQWEEHKFGSQTDLSPKKKGKAVKMGAIADKIVGMNVGTFPMGLNFQCGVGGKIIS